MSRRSSPGKARVAHIPIVHHDGQSSSLGLESHPPIDPHAWSRSAKGLAEPHPMPPAKGSPLPSIRGELFYVSDRLGPRKSQHPQWVVCQDGRISIYSTYSHQASLLEETPFDDIQLSFNFSHREGSERGGDRADGSGALMDGPTAIDERSTMAFLRLKAFKQQQVAAESRQRRSEESRSRATSFPRQGAARQESKGSAHATQESSSWYYFGVCVLCLVLSCLLLLFLFLVFRFFAV